MDEKICSYCGSDCEVGFGKCHCGCGQKTNMDSKKGAGKNRPRKYLMNHDKIKHINVEELQKKRKESWNYSKSDYGYCQCGCGRKTEIAKRKNTKSDIFKGLPYRYIRGHANKISSPTSREKWCTGCKQFLENSLFGKDKSSSDGLARKCKVCRKSEASPSRFLKNKNSNGYKVTAEEGYYYRLKAVYGLTKEDHIALLRKQGGTCAICGFLPFGDKFPNNKLFVDHCHSNGNVRGLLCNNCNKALGLFRDNPNLLKKAMDYLGS